MPLAIEHDHRVDRGCGGGQQASRCNLDRCANLIERYAVARGEGLNAGDARDDFILKLNSAARSNLLEDPERAVIE
jgi:hypothetical protein